MNNIMEFEIKQPDKILIIDDEPLILFSLRRLFKKNGIDIDVESDSIKALSLIKDNQYKIIICDYKMPNLNGAELLNLVKESSPDSIRIMISAHVNQDNLSDVINKGEVYKFINKPWDDSTLINIIQESLTKYNKSNVLLFSNEEQTTIPITEQEIIFLPQIPQIDLKTLDISKQFILQRNEIHSNLEYLINITSPKILAHGKRVSKLCAYIAKYLNLSIDQQKNIFFAGLYHDIGKVFEVVSQIDHQDVSFNILNNFNELKSAAVITQKHHLNLITDPNIIIESKILAIVDYFDKMIHKKNADEKPIVLTELLAEMQLQPTLFDQAVLLSFKNVILNDFKLNIFFNETKIGLLDMEEGQVLSRPIITNDGKMLLNSEFKLTKDIIIRLFSHNKTTPIKIPLYIYSKPPEKPFNYNEFLESKIKLTF